MWQDSTLNKDIDHAGLCWTLFEYMSSNKEKYMAKLKKMVIAQRDVLLKSGEYKVTGKKPAAHDVASAKKPARELPKDVESSASSGESEDDDWRADISQ